MKKLVSLLLAATLTAGMALAAQSLSFSAVIDNLDLQKNTKLHVTEYWKSVRDQSVSWSGEAYDVQGGKRSMVKLYLADKSRPLYKGYNIVVTSTDVEKAAAIKKGQRVKFTGTLTDYSSKRSGAVIEVSNASLQ
ncbi:MAG: hypothetical protein QM808_18145 [Steroidobacteraceae bacterium]